MVKCTIQFQALYNAFQTIGWPHHHQRHVGMHNIIHMAAAQDTAISPPSQTVGLIQLLEVIQMVSNLMAYLVYLVE